MVQITIVFGAAVVKIIAVPPFVTVSDTKLKLNIKSNNFIYTKFICVICLRSSARKEFKNTN